MKSTPIFHSGASLSKGTARHSTRQIDSCRFGFDSAAAGHPQRPGVCPRSAWQRLEDRRGRIVSNDQDGPEFPSAAESQKPALRPGTHCLLDQHLRQSARVRHDARTRHENGVGPALSPAVGQRSVMGLRQIGCPRPGCRRLRGFASARKVKRFRRGRRL